MKRTAKTKRGRPSKFDRPSRVVALTLPEDVIAGLHRTNSDLAWAIVGLVENGTGGASSRPRTYQNAELVSIQNRQFLIAVNRAVFKRLPGVEIIPLDGNRAFLALKVGHGVSDLELAVVDRLDEGIAQSGEREALIQLRAQLREWRRDPGLTFEQRAIIVAKRRPARRARS